MAKPGGNNGGGNSNLIRITGSNSIDDVLVGTVENELIRGLKGNDQLFGEGGDDVLKGGDGNDTLSGGAGADTLDGGKDFDRALYDDSVIGYDIVIGSTTTTITDVDGSNGNSGQDLLIDVEEATFSDVTVYLDGRNNAPFIASADATGGVSELNDGDVNENEISRTALGILEFREFDRTVGHLITVTDGGSDYRGALTAVLTDADTTDSIGVIAWTFSVDDADIDDLAEGQVLEQAYDITIDDGQGGTTTQRITISISGSNDVPEIDASVSTLTGGVVEIADNAPGETTSDLTTSGSVVFSDVDILDTHTVIITPQSEGYRGTFSLGAPTTTDTTTNGEVTWTFVVNDGDIDDLAVGQVLTQRYDVTIDDGNGGTATGTATITITGANDRPVAAKDTATANENGASILIDVLANDSDVDSDDDSTTLKVVAASSSSGAAVTFTGAPGAGITYDPNSTNAFEGLAAGETTTDTITYTIEDSHGAQSSAVVTLTVTGTNDAPIAEADVVGVDLTGFVLNPENGHYYKVVTDAPLSWYDAQAAAEEAGGYLATVTSDAEAQFLLGIGALGWLGGSDLEQEGQWHWVVGPEAGTLFWSGGINGSAPDGQYANWNIGEPNGSTFENAVGFRPDGLWNDGRPANTNPYIIEISGVASTELVYENGPAVALDVLANDTDVDSDDYSTTLKVVAASSSSGATVTFAGTPGAGITYDPNSTTAFEGLAAGETTTDTITYTIEDSHGAQSTAGVTVTVTGTNDAPDLTNINTIISTDFTVNSDNGTNINIFGFGPGAALVENGHLQLADNINGNAGAISIDPAVAPADFVASFDLFIGNSTSSIPADGISFNYGTGIPTSGGWAWENGLAEVGLSVGFETYPTGRVFVEVNGVEIANINVGGALITESFVPVLIEVTDGYLTVVHDQTEYISGLLLPGYAPPSDSIFAIGARSGGFNAEHLIDNLTISSAIDPNGSVLIGKISEIADNAPGELTSDLMTNGKIVFSDVDVLDTHTVSFTPQNAGYRGTFSLVAPTTTDATTGGEVAWTYVVNDADIDDLTAGQVLTQRYVITIDDGNGGTISETVTVVISGAADNSAPVAADDGVSGDEDTVINGNVLANDTDANGDALTATLVSDVSNGTLALNTDGSFTYTPNANFNGTDSFTYFANDGTVDSATQATVTLTVNPVNDDPIAAAVDLTPTANDAGAEDAAFTFTAAALLAGASDVDGDTLYVTAVALADASAGTLSDDGVGNYTFTPTPNFAANNIALTYTVSDGNGGTANGTATFDISAVADAPTVTTEAIFSGETLSFGNEFTVNASGASDQRNSQAIQLSDGRVVFTWMSAAPSVDGSQDGIATRIGTVQSDGSVVFGSESTVNANGTGNQRYPQLTVLSDSRVLFTWTSADLAVDGSGYGIAARIGVVQSDDSITFSDEFTVNDSAANDQISPQVTVLSDGRVLFTWNSGDPLVDGSSSGISARIGSVQNDGSVIFADEFTVNVIGAGIQHAPQVTALSDGRVLFTWTSADSAVDGNSYGIAARIGTFQQDGSITFSDELTVNSKILSTQYVPQVTELSDGRVLFVWFSGDPSVDGSLTGISARIGTVEDDGSVLFAEEFTVNADGANSQLDPQVIMLSDGRILFVWESNDPSTDGSDFGIAARIGTVQADGSVDFSDEFTVNANGTARQFYPQVTELSDGRVLFTWESADPSVDGSGYGISARILTFTPVGSDFALPVDVALTDTDGSETIRSVTLAGLPDGFIVSDGSNTATSDGVNLVDVTGWDLSILHVTAADSFAGDISIIVAATSQEASNGDTATSTTTIDVTITPANTAPSAVADTATGNEDTVITGNVLANDTDGDGDALSATLLGDVTNGTLVLNTDGSFTYTPNANFNGTDSFTYVANDGKADSTTPATVTITVNPVNDPAVIGGDATGSVTEDGTPIARGALTVSDVDGLAEETFVAQTDTAGTYGTFSIDAAGAWTYTLDNASVTVQALNAGDAVTDAFTITSADGTTSSVEITVNGTDEVANTAPAFPVGDGIVTTDLGTSNDVGLSVTVQSDGGILVAGYAINRTGTDFALVRYNPDGNLDTGFGGGDGIVTTPVGLSDDNGWSVTVQADGAILVAGYTHNGTDYDFALVRYTPDGSLDTGFGGGDGIVTTPVGTSNDFGYSVAVQADGAILVAGYTHNGTDTDFALVRYTPDGSLDTGFGGGDGIVTTPGSTSYDYGYSVAVQADGAILVAGYASNDFALVRYTPDGSLDTGFGGGDGIVTTDLGSSSDAGLSVTVQADGAILVTGITFNGTDYDFALVRYNPDGTLDTKFGGGDGIVTTPIGTSNDYGRSVMVQSDGGILVAGYSRNSTDYDFALVRYNPDGSLDTTFDAAGALGGRVTYLTGGAPVVLDSDVIVTDAELAAAGNYSGATLTLARDSGADASDTFLASGSLAALTAGGDLVLSGVVIGTVTQNSGGTLLLTFGAAATPSAVNETLSSVAYANTSGTPPASVDIAWTFSDGNAGAQGSGGALAATGTTTVLIEISNTAPIAIADSATGDEDNLITGNVLTNDTDVDNDPLTATLVTDVSNGTLALNSDGSFTYAPDTDFNGTDGFTYVANDGLVDSDPATVTLTVNPANDVPIATAVDLTPTAQDAGTEDTNFTFAASALLAGASDVDGDSLTVASVALVDGNTGTLSDDGAGTYTFTPTANFAANDIALTYTVSDGNGGTASGTATFNIIAVADAPSVTAEAIFSGETLSFANEFTVNANGILSQDLSQVATLSDGRVLFTWQSGDPAVDGNGNGIAARFGTLSPDGSIAFSNDFTVNANFASEQLSPQFLELASGQLLFTWASNDPRVDGNIYGIAARIGTVQADGSVVFTGEFTVNANGVGYQYYPQITELSDGRVLFTWQSNDPAVDGDQYGIAARIGTVQVDGSLAFADEFTVNANSVSSQDNPQITELSDGRVLFTWDSSDPAVDGDQFGIAARIGTVQVDGSLAFADEFTVNANSVSSQGLPQVTELPDGRVLFTWTSNDPAVDGDLNGIAARIGTVTVGSGVAFSNEFTVNASGVNIQAFSQVTALADGRVLFTWQSSDPAVDGFGFGISARIGTVQTDGSVSFTDEFTVNANGLSDQTRPQVTELSDGRILFAWTSGDLAVDGSSIGIAARILTITPAGSDFALPVNVALTDADGSETISSITLTGLPQGFIVTDGSNTATSDGPNLVDVTGWDLASLQVTPANGYSGNVSLTVAATSQEASNGATATSTTTVDLTIAATNAVPVAVDDTMAGDEDTLISGNVLTNDTDVESGPLTATLVSDVSNGTLALNSDGSFTYTPNANFNGTDSFTYLANDGTVDSAAPATVTIAVNPVNDAPVTTAPGSALTTVGNSTVFSSANGNAITVTDVDVDETAVLDNTLQLSLSAGAGVLTLAAIAGITFVSGGNNSAAFTIVGTVADLNTALDGLAYTPDVGFTGGDQITITTSDLGHSGAGGVLTDAHVISIALSPIEGTDLGETINGTPYADFINALGGNDTVNALTGSDQIDGGSGDDTINTGIGPNVDTDNVDGGAGNDIINIQSGTAAGTINGGLDNDLIESFTAAFAGSIDGGDGTDTLKIFNTETNFAGTTFSGIETTQLGYFAKIDAAQAANLGNIDVIWTATGLTLSTAGLAAFNDVSIGDGERLTITANAAGSTVTFGTGSATTGTGTVTFNGGIGNDVVTTFDGNDTLNGNGGNDTLNGGEGNDIINGGVGSDTLNGNGGEDTINTGIGANVDTDNVDGGSGNDIINVQSGTSAGTITGGLDNDLIESFTATFAGSIDGGDGTDTLKIFNTATNFAGTTFSGIETTQLGYFATIDAAQAANLGNIDVIWTATGLTLSTAGLADFNDVSIGDGERLTITANAGGSTVTFGAGSATTGTGSITFNGGVGNDTFTGFNGNDILNGGAGSDTLNGGAGNDIINGGTGDDLIIFTPGGGADIIQNFSAGLGSEDQIDLTAFDVAIASAAIAGATQAGADTVLDFGGGDTLTLVGITSTALHSDDWLI